MSGTTAWVTLATNDSYCLGALVLANSLKRVNTVHQLVVLITKDVTQSMRQQLSSVFNIVKEVNVLDSGDEANLALMARPDLGITFTKLQCWNLTEFSKCVFLDADILIVQNCDELFEREELSAAPDVGWPDCFNSGVFVFVPSKDTYKALIDCALSQGSFDGGDQGLLNLYFRDWATKDIKKHLPFTYNMVSSATYSYLPAFKVFGSQVKIVHFIGTNKPWLQSGTTTSTLSSFLDLWWNIFNTNVAKNLTSEMAGWAGVLAGGERSTIEEVWRRQNWEQGIIDYMGRDSFDNIWKKISESIGSKSAPAPVVPIPASAPTEKPSESQPSAEVAAPSTEIKSTPEVVSQQPPAPKDAGIADAILATGAEPPKTEQSGKSAEQPKEIPSALDKTDAAPVSAATPVTDKPAVPVPSDSEEIKSLPSAEIPKTDEVQKKVDESPKEEVTVKPSETIEETPVAPLKDAVDVTKDKSQDIPKVEAPSTPVQPSQPNDIPPVQADMAPVADATAPPPPVVPLPEKPTVPETPTAAKSESTPKDTAPKETEQKPVADKTAESVLLTQDVPKSEVSAPPTVSEAPKADAPPTDAKLASQPEEKKPEKKEETVVKGEEVKPPTAAPTETPVTTEKKEDSAPGEAVKEAPSKVEPTPAIPLTSEAPKETPPAVEKPTKDDSASKPPPSAPEVPKESTPVSTEKSVKEDPSATVPLTEATVVPASVAPAEAPAQPGTPTEAKPSTESKKSSSTPPTTPQAEAASSSTPVSAPVPPKRKGNKEQKFQNGGKQSKGKK